VYCVVSTWHCPVLPWFKNTIECFFLPILNLIYRVYWANADAVSQTVFCVGLIGEKQISAFSICFQVEGFAWMVMLLFFFALFFFVITFSYCQCMVVLC